MYCTLQLHAILFKISGKEEKNRKAHTKAQDFTPYVAVMKKPAKNPEYGGHQSVAVLTLFCRLHAKISNKQKYGNGYVAFRPRSELPG